MNADQLPTTRKSILETLKRDGKAGGPGIDFDELGVNVLISIYPYHTVGIIVPITVSVLHCKLSLAQTAESSKSGCLARSV